MAANNETGALQPIARITEIAHARGIPVHTDAVQAATWRDLGSLLGGADLVTLAAHKMAGPLGIGALVLQRPVDLEPLLRGGGQQRGRRPGTEAPALCAGFGAACARVSERREAEAVRVAMLRDDLQQHLLRDVPGLIVTSAQADRLPNTLHVCVRGAVGSVVVARLDLEGIAISGGSACSSGATHASHVLAAMEIDPELAAGALRLSLGYDTGRAEIDRAADLLARAVRDASLAAPGR